MTFRALAGLFTTWVLLGTSSCSGKGASFESTGDGGTESGADAGAGKAGATTEGGSNASGGSSLSKAGSSAGGTNTGGTSNADQPSCETDFDSLDRSCTNAEDCVPVHHQIDCCGTILIMGLASSEQAAFDALEQYCSARFPACGCAAQGNQLEDGSVIDFTSDAFRVECVDGQCRSQSTNPTTACGDVVCSSEQYCYQFVGGPAGSEPSYSCMPLGDCRDCECLSTPGCQCSDTGGSIKVFCAAP